MTTPAADIREYPVMKFSQPAGDFYLACMPATEVSRISFSEPRTYRALGTPAEGLNRPLSVERVEGLRSTVRAQMLPFQQRLFSPSLPLTASSIGQRRSSDSSVPLPLQASSMVNIASRAFAHPGQPNRSRCR